MFLTGIRDTGRYNHFGVSIPQDPTVVERLHTIVYPEGLDLRTDIFARISAPLLVPLSSVG